MTERLSTGTTIIDEITGGGFERDAVTTIYGPAGAGKTNIAIMAAITAVKEGKKVIFVDTEGGFSIERLKQITGEHEEFLEKVLFFHPTTFEEQVKSFENIKRISEKKEVGLIIVDTISMLYRLERSFNDDSKEFNRELGLQVVALNKIAREKQIPVLITNQVYTSFDNGGVHMIGGDMLKYGSKCLLELQVLPEGKRKAILRKHRSLPVNKEALFEIVQEGIAPIKKSFKIF
ncbi:DNA repair and recombination protein RadB [Candidatus Woesearchaeota archaeon]|nr:DNA repair and recombination protein RadB [Candidatus Woesearchaeota archaeon]